MARVFVVDDHPIVPMAIRLALRDVEDLSFQASSNSAGDALPMIGEMQPDALILDLVLDRLPRIDLVERCRELLPRSTIVVFTSLIEDGWPGKALAAGADDVLSKGRDVAFLIGRLRELLIRRGHAANDRAMHFDPNDVKLTRRETEVASRLARGVSIQMIARDLKISGKTAAAHRDNLRTKMHCETTRELTVLLARLRNS